jgi:hypothetical protein
VVKECNVSNPIRSSIDPRLFLLLLLLGDLVDRHGWMKREEPWKRKKKRREDRDRGGGK